MTHDLLLKEYNTRMSKTYNIEDLKQYFNGSNNNNSHNKTTQNEPRFEQRKLFGA